MENFDQPGNPFFSRTFKLKSRWWSAAFVLILVVAFLSLLLGNFQSLKAAGGELTVEILAGYNLVVDSNVQAPSTNGPSAATVAARVCNASATPVTDVNIYIGDQPNNTPGVYPGRDTSDPAFIAQHPRLNSPYIYFFRHAGGSLGLADASRQAGTLQPGECTVQYWTFTYPRCESGIEPPCGSLDPVWGETNSNTDDLWLRFDVWAKGTQGGSAVSATDSWTMTMRNEISAMANKIQPNGNPSGVWFNTNTASVKPGSVITTNGILYRIGNVGAGFDNNGDFVPDVNFWVQPIGDTGTFDPGCFRLIRTSGLITIEGGSPQVFTFTDQLFFSRPQVPSDNTNVIGEVFYTFLALGSNCAAGPSPYQEAASGYDNEKFNADYGAGGPPVIISEQAVVGIDKSSYPDVLPLGSIVTYTLPFWNASSSASAGLVMYSGAYVNNPLVVSDSIPAGTIYKSGSATYTLNFSPNNAAVIKYSTDNGASWTTTEPATGVTTLQWWLNDPLPPLETGVVHFSVIAPFTYSGPPIIENCGNLQFDGGPSVAWACDPVQIQGSALVGNETWADLNNDGAVSAGESYLNNIGVSIYWDKNNNGVLDLNDTFMMTTTSGLTTSGFYTFTSMPPGSYLVKVDRNDSDLPVGYRLTTNEIYPVTVTTTNVLTADFGFAPSLGVVKMCQNAYQGRDMVYNILVQNLRPGGGESTGVSQCRYTVWSNIVHPDKNTSIPIGGGPANAQWLSTGNITGEPDDKYTNSAMADNTDLVGLSGFNTTPKRGSISKVEVLIVLKESAEMQSADALDVSFYMTDTARGTKTFAGAYFTQTVGQLYNVITDITSLNPGGASAWKWENFAGDISELSLSANKGGGTTGDLAVDAVAFLVTVDQPCTALSMNEIISNLPVTDTFDPSRVQFVSANPAPSAVDTSAGIITWTNVGPLYPNETHNIQVTFRALQPTTSTATVINNVGATGASFSDGGLTGNRYATATCLITATGTITGRAFSDLATTGWQAPDGYQSNDYGIPGMTMTLYACVWDNDLTTPIDPNTDPNYNSGRICTAQANGAIKGTWAVLQTLTTNATGFYTFTGLLNGFYYVQANTAILPGGFSETTEAYDVQSTSGGFNCPGSGSNACDSIWGNTTLRLDTTNFNPINTAGEKIPNVNFGYSMPAMLFGNVWNDVNGNSTRETGEPGLDNGTAGVTVTLYNFSTGAVVSTTQTDAAGNYKFVGVPAGTYTITVNTATLPGTGWSSTSETAPSGAVTSTLDSQIQTVSLVAGQVSGSYNFGYHQTGTGAIGDRLYYDVNGNAMQDANEEGIPNITVYLYADLNANGTIDIGTDAVVITATTTATGFYKFDSLAPGSYIVSVDSADSDFPVRYYPTQDPDEDAVAGTICKSCNNQGVVSNLTTTYTDSIDFGYQPYGFNSIGDLVWRDLNGDGLQNGAYETGIVSITVWLQADFNNDGVFTTILTTTTAADGSYLFSNLPDGSYRVVVNNTDSDLPVDALANRYLPTTPITTSVISLAYITPTMRSWLDADFGFSPPATVGDFIWQDNNGNGEQDAGEPGIPGVTVQLYLSGTSTLVSSTTTDASGGYTFTNILSGSYSVVVVTSTLPFGYYQSGDPDATGPCVDGGAAFDDCNSTSSFKLRAGGMDRTRDFGYLPPRVIGDYVWLDADQDGIQDPTEAPIPSVVITLTDPVGGVVTTTTDIAGYYSFGANVLPISGNYTVSINLATLPLPLVPTFDRDGTLDNLTVVPVTVTTVVTDADFGYRYNGLYNISGTVFYDQLSILDGLTETFRITDTDIPYYSVPVYLWDQNNKLIATTQTDAAGNYTFTQLYGGGITYTVSVNGTAPQLISQRLTASPDGSHTYQRVVIQTSDITRLDFGFYPAVNITKSVVPTGSIGAGTTVTYTLVVSNSQSTIANDVTITDIIPSDMTYVAASLTMTPTTAGTVVEPSGIPLMITLSPITVAANSLVTITYRATVNASIAPGVDAITNTAHLSTTTGITHSSSVSNPISAADLLITKSDDPDPVMSGGVLTYTLIFTNVGATAASDVTVTEALPPEVTYGGDVSLPSGMTRSSTTPPTWITPTLEAGQSGTIVFTVTVGHPVTGAITNTVTITSTSPDSVPGNNQDVEPTLVYISGFSLDKLLVSANPAYVGDLVTYSITIVNTGTTTLATLPLTDTFNATYLAYSSATPAPDTTAAGQLNWTNVGPIAVGGQVVLTVTFTALMPTPVTTNKAIVGATDIYSNVLLPGSDAEPVTIVTSGYVLTKTLLSANPVYVGDLVTYSVTVANTGTIALDSVPLTDTYDATYLGYSSATPAPDTTAAGQLNWANIGPIAAGGQTVVTVTFTALAPVSPTINTATTAATDTLGTALPPQSDAAPVSIVTSGYLLTKSLASASPPRVGHAVLHSFPTRNTGTIALDSVPLTDTYDATYLGYSSATPAPDTTAAGQLNWANIGPIAAGGQTVVTVTFTALAPVSPTINTATTAATDTLGTALPPQSDAAPVTIVVSGFTLTKTLVSANPAYVGELVTYSITIVNTGTTTLTTVPLTDTFDGTYLSYSSATPAPDTTAAGQLNWNNVGPIAAGGQRVVTVTFTALAPTAATTNTATASAVDGPGTVLPPQSDEAPVTIVVSGFTLTKTLASANPAYVGDPVTFSITIVNTGTTALTTVPLTDTFNATYLSYSSATPAPDTTAAGQLNWNNVGPIAVGGQRVVTVTFTALAPIPVTLNTATAGAIDGPGTVLPPQTDQAAVTIISSGFVVTKTLLSANPVYVGQPVTYSITVVNTGTTTLVTVPLTDTFDGTYLSYSSATPAPDTTAAGQLNWNNVGPIAAGGQTVVTVTFTALAPVSPTINTATVSAVDDQGKILPPQSDLEPVSIVASGYILTKTLVSSSPVAVGQPVIFSIMVVNTGTTTLTTVPLTDTYDATYLGYSSANPVPDTTAAGQLNWTNLGPITAGGQRVVTVTFTALMPVSPTLNTATTAATDTLSTPLPPLSDNAPVAIVESGFVLTKTLTSANPVYVGQAVIYEITVVNTGTTTLATVPLTDTYDATYLSYSSASPAPNTTAAGQLNWTNIGPLAAGGQRVVTVTFTALAPVSPTLNTATAVATDTNGIVVPPQTDQEPVSIIASGFVLTKTLTSANPVYVGQAVIYEITVVNTGTTTLATVPLTDTYDATYLSYSSATPAPDTTAAGQLNWTNIGPLAAGGQRVVTVTFTALALVSPTLNTATAVATDTNGTMVPPQTDQEPVSIVSSGFVLTKTLTSANPVYVGQAVVYSITIVNTGTTTLATVPLTDTYDATYLSYSSANPAPDTTAAGQLNWTNIGSIAAGGQRVVTVTFTALAPVSPTLNTATAVATDTNGTVVPPQTDQEPVSIIANGFVLTKTLMSANPVYVGQPVVYSITVVNTGTTTLVTVPLTDTFNVTYLSYSSATPAPDTTAAGQLNWTNIGPIAVGGQRVVTVTFTALAPVSPTLNTATAVATDTNGTMVPPQTDQEPVSIVNSGFILTKTLTSANPVYVGQSVIYEITVVNTGTTTLATVPLTDTFNATYLAYSSATPAPDTTAAGLLNWTNLGPLAAGGQRVVTVTFTALAPIPATLNTATAVATDTNGTVVPPQTDQEPVSIIASGFVLTKTLTSANPVYVGQSVVYEITVVNTGTTTLATVPLTDTFNATYLGYSSATPAPDTTAAGQLNWTNIGPIAAGGQRVVTVTFTALAPIPATLNTATAVATDTNGTVVPPQTDQEPVSIIASGYVLTKTLTSANPVYVGQSVIYEITVVNTGTTTLATVPLTDTYDATYLSYGSANPTPDTTAAGQLNWTNIGPIAAGGQRVVTVTFTALAPIPATLNTATAVATDTNGTVVPPQTDQEPVSIIASGFVLTKTLTSANPVYVGQSVVYSITVVNTGTTTLATVPLTDTYDATYLSYSSASPVPDTTAAGQLNWTNIGPIAAGGQRVVTVTFTALAPIPATLNTATAVATDTNGTVVPPQTDQEPVSIVSSGFVLTKTLTSANPVYVGQSVVYEITVVNTGTTTLATVPLTDTYDATYLSYGSANPTPDTTAAGQLNWTNIGPIAAGGQRVVTVTFTALAPVSPTLNTATTVSTDTNGIVVPPQTDQEPVTIVSSGFILTKTLTSANPVYVGQAVVYSITVVNTGTTTLATVPLTDTYDATYLSYSSASPVPDTTAAGQLNWTNIGPIAAGGQRVVTVTFTALAPIPATLNTATAVATDTNGTVVPPQTDQEPVSIIASGFVLTKTLTSANPVYVGQSVIYEITVVNTGTTTLATVPLTDTYDATYLSYSSATPAPDTTAAGQLNWTNIGPIAAGGQRVVTVTFTALASVSPTLNTATAVATDTNGTVVPPQTDQEPVSIIASGFVLTKTLTSANPVYVGQSVIYEITVVNTGTTTLATVPLTDTFNATYLAYSSATPAPDTTAAGQLNWTNLGPIAAGGQRVVTVTFTALAPVSPTLNTATVSATDTNGTVVPPQTDQEPVSIVSSGFVLTKTLTSANPVYVGQSVVYEITVVNTGTTTLATVPLTDTYDATYLSYSSATPAPDTTAAGQLNWANIGPIAAGGQTVVTVTFTALAPVSPTLNTATAVATDTNGTVVPPQTDQEPVSIIASGFVLTKTLTSANPVYVGQSVIYEITVVNTGTTTLATVPLTDTFNATYLAYSSATPAPDMTAAGQLNWTNLGPIAAGGQRVVTVTFTALAPIPATLNTATAVATDTNGTVVPPQTDQEPVSIVSSGFVLTKTLTSANPVYVGQSVVYEITVVNTGTTTLATVPLTDTYDATYLSYSSATPAPDTTAAGQLNWTNLGPIAAGGQRVVTVTFTALAPVSPTLNTATAVATDTNGTVVPPQTDQEPVSIVSSGFVLTKTLTSANPVYVGQSVVYEITVVNTGTTTLLTVPLTDTYDATYLSYNSATPAPDTTAAGQLNWTNIGPIAAGGQRVVTVTFTALASVSPTLNTATAVATDTNGTMVPPQTDQEPVTIVSSGFVLTKTLTSANPVYVGQAVVYEITVVNTGTTTLATVPLTDTYDATYLAYSTANPLPDTTAAGQLNWANLGPIAAGGQRVVTVTFTALAPVSPTLNTATAVATDTNGTVVPPQTDQEPVTIVSSGFVLTKTLTSANPVYVGQSVIYEITVVNTGTTTLATVPLTDTYDATYLSYSSATPAPDTTAAGQLNWTNIGPIAAGGQRVVTVTFTALAPIPATLNTATAVATDTNGTVVPPQTDQEPVSIVSSGFILTKTLTSANPVYVGQSVIYEITVVNTGTTTLATVPLTDTYDATYLAYSTANPLPDTTAAGQLNWTNLGPIAAGGQRVVTVTFTALAPVSPTLNTATAVATDTNGTVVPPQTDQEPVSIVSSGFVLTKTLTSANPVYVGQSVVYEITVVNTGTTTLATVPLTDTYDATYLSYSSATPAPDTTAAGQLNWTNLGPIAAGGQRVVTVTFTALAPVSPTLNTATAVATDTNGTMVPPQTDQEPVTIVSSGFVLTKTLTSANPVYVGQAVVYEITVVNTGTTTLATVPLTDTYDATYLSYGSANPTPDTTAAGQLNWTNIGPIAAGGQRVVTVTFTALVPVSPTLNTATAVATDTNGIVVPPHTDQEPVTIVSSGFVLTKTLTSANPVYVGQAVIYEITVVNTGTTTLATVPLTDTYDATYLAYSTANPLPDTTAAGQLNWTNLGPIAAGGQAVVTVTFTALAPVSPTLNTATAVATDTNGTVVPPQTDQEPVSIIASGFVLTKTLTSANPVYVGQSVIYEITVVNTGTTTLATVPLTDTYDATYLSYGSANPTPDTTAAGQLNWTNIGPIAAGGQRVVTVTFTALVPVSPTLNTATAVATDTNGTVVPPQTDQEPVSIVSSGFVLTKTLTSANPVYVGQSVIYEIMVVNTGTTTLLTVPLTDTYDATYLSYNSATPAPDTTAAGQLNWTNIGPIAAGGQTVVTVTFTALAPVSPTLNTATAVATDTNGTVVPPQTDQEPVTIVSSGFTVMKTLLSANPVYVGQPVAYVLTVINTGTIPLNSVPLTDTFDPLYLAYSIAIPAPDATAAGQLNWTNIGPIAVGGQRMVTVTFTALAPVSPTINTVTAAATDTIGTLLPPQTDQEPESIVQSGFVLTKTLISANPVYVGQAVIYEITVANTGTTTLLTVPLTDTYDAAYLSYSTANPLPDTTAAGQLNWTNLGPIAAGGQRVVTVTFTALAPVSPTLNTATVSATDEPGRILPPQTDQEPVTIVSSGFILTKTLTSANPVYVGQAVVYSITVVNTGTTTLLTVPLTDTYDAIYLSYSSANPAPDTTAAGQLNWTNLGPIAAGGQAVVTVTFTALAPISPTLNTATAVATDTNGTVVPPQTDQEPVSIVYSGFVLTKTLVSANPVAVGQPVVYSITVVNTGTTTLATVPLTDTYDATYLAYSSANPAPDTTALGQLNWTNIGPIAAGGQQVVTVTFTALASVSPTLNTATAVATDTIGTVVPPQTDQEPVTIVYSGFVLTKTLISANPVYVGQSVIYEITVVNTGTTTLATVPLTDTYDATYLSYSSANPTPDTTAAGQLNWTNIGPIAAGGQRVVTVTFTALAPVSPTFNTATAVATDTNGTVVPPQTDQEPVTIVHSGFVLTKTLISVNPAYVGQSVIYEITVVNTGTTALATVPLTDTYDATYLSYSSATPAPDTTAAGQLTWTNIGPIAAGGQTVVTVTFTALAPVSPTLNTATAVATDTNGIVVPPLTDQEPVTIVISGFTLTKTLVSANPAYVGQPVIYEITVVNTGTTPLATVPLTDTFNATYLAYSSATPAPDTATAGQLTWTNIGPIAVGGQSVVTVTFTAVTVTLATTNTATASAVDNNGVVVPPQIDLEPVTIVASGFTVSKTLLTASPVTVGQPVNYQITVVNTGTTTLATVPVTDTFDPTYLAYISANPAPDTTAAGQLVWNNVGPIAAGGQAVVTVTFNTLTVTFATTNTATASATDLPGTTLPPTSSVVPVAIIDSPAIDIAKTVNVAWIAPNQVAAVTYTLTITNIGNTPLNPVNITDTLPAGVTYVAGSGVPAPTTVNGQTLVWTDVNSGTPLTPGGVAHITFLAQVPISIGTYVNQAWVEGVYPGGVVTDTSTVPLTVEDPSVNLSKEVVQPGVVNGMITFTIKVTNTGPSTIDVLPLFDRFSGDIIYAHGTPTADMVDNVGGMLAWNDLTLFFGNMAPGQVFSITTVFSLTTIENYFTATNQAVVTNAVDIFNNDANIVTDVVHLTLPTAIKLLYFQAHPEGQVIRLKWATATELDNFGFRILRSSTGDFADAVEVGFIAGQGHGDHSGATYTYLDGDVSLGQSYTYWLADVDFMGNEVYHAAEPVYLRKLSYQLFLPIVLRNAP